MRKTIYIGFAIICLALSVSLYQHWQRSSRTQLIICDVGQGDTVLLASHTTQIVIDAGPATNRSSDCLSKYLSPFDRQLEVLLTTHADADHIGGAKSLGDSYTIDTAILPFGGSDQASTAYNQLLNLSKSQNVKHAEVLARNDTIQVAPFELRILWPPQNLPIDQYDDNQRSYVIEVGYQSQFFLFMGDADTTIMEQLLQAGSLRRNYDYLLVPHHGSKNSASEIFYASIKPMHTFVSSGQGNPYGHPHQQVLNLLKKYQIPYTLTAETGDIVIDLESK